MLEIRLFATFREGRQKILHLEASEYETVQTVIDFLNIPKEDVAICLINGFHSKMEAKLKDTDVVALFPPVGGG